MSRRLKRIAIRLTLVVIAGGTLFIVGAVLYVGPRLLGKSSAPRSMDHPEQRIADPRPITQLESHTCGFLAMSSAYTAYGLSPDAKNLRFRLGVDTKAHPFDDSSTGTLHPDLYRVLVQDGFTIEEIDPDSPDARQRLIAHLENDDLALVLIKRRQTGGLHWVLADKPLPDSQTDETHLVRIVDSLANLTYGELLDDFLPNHVLSIVAIAPSADPTDNTMAAHRNGLAEMKRVFARMNSR